MNASGAVVILAGVWILCQVLGGNALERLNIVPSGSSTSSPSTPTPSQPTPGPGSGTTPTPAPAPGPRPRPGA